MAGGGRYGGTGRPKPGSWPEEVHELTSRLRALDGEIARNELCRPGFAAELRREASAVCMRLEVIKTAIVVGEINGRQR
jgi:hypothetical protein